MNAPAKMTSVSFEPSATDSRPLRDAFSRFTTGITVVTAMGGDGPVGITANSFSSISLDPPLVLWAISKDSRRYQPFALADHFAIHVLGAEQKGICDHFARSGEAFDKVDHAISPEGVPVLSGCLARFECARWAVHDCGDHSLVVGRVLRGEYRTGDGLAFFGGDFGAFTAG